MDEVEGSQQHVATTFFELVTYRYEASAGPSVPERRREEDHAKRRLTLQEGGSCEKAGVATGLFRKRNEELWWRKMVWTMQSN